MGQRITRDPDIELTAYHEAAHAVIALHYGWDVHDVNIHINNPGSGHIDFSVPKSPYSIKRNGRTSEILLYWQHYLTQRKNYCRMLLAGPMAEAKVMATPLRSIGATADLKKVRDLLRDLDGLRGNLLCHVDIPTDYRVKFFPTLQQETRLLLNNPKIWESIKVLADDLCDWGTLSGRDIAETVQWARLPSTKQLNFQWDDLKYQEEITTNDHRSYGKLRVISKDGVKIQPEYISKLPAGSKITKVMRPPVKHPTFQEQMKTLQENK